LEAHAAREEAQWVGVKAWMEESEEKWEFCHEQNVLWAAGNTNMVAEIMNEKRREVQMEIQEAKGITDLDLEMNPERPQMEASRHAPTIHPAPAVPNVTTTPKAIQLRGREKSTLIAPPKKNKAPENAPKGPKSEAKDTKAAKEPEGRQQHQKQQQRKPTYAEKAAALAMGQSKEGEFQVIERKKKKGEKKELDDMVAIATNKNTLEYGRVPFKRNNTLPISQKQDVEIVSAVNRALHASRVPHHIIMRKITTHVRGTITALATPQASADMLVAWREVVVTATRSIDQGIINLEKNETWEKVKMHGISFDQYAVKKSGGLGKLRQEIQSEKEGVVVLMANN
jgi:hypothetical protein